METKDTFILLGWAEEKRQWEHTVRANIATWDEKVKQAVAKMTLIILVKLCQEGEYG